MVRTLSSPVRRALCCVCLGTLCAGTLLHALEARAGPWPRDALNSGGRQLDAGRDAAVLLALQASHAAGALSVRLIVIADRTFMEAGDSLLEMQNTGQACLTCHDGTVGRPVPSFPDTGVTATTLPDTSHGSPRDSLGNHPVGSLYPVARREFVPRASLPPGLVLVNGRVECVTCHAGADRDGNLSMRPTSWRCPACHDK